MDGGLLIENISTACGPEGPDEDSDPGDWDYDRFGHEQPPKIVWMHVKERQLSDPEYDERDHSIC